MSCCQSNNVKDNVNFTLTWPGRADRSVLSEILSLGVFVVGGGGGTKLHYKFGNLSSFPINSSL